MIGNPVVDQAVSWLGLIYADWYLDCNLLPSIGHRGRADGTFSFFRFPLASGFSFPGSSLSLTE